MGVAKTQTCKNTKFMFYWRAEALRKVWRDFAEGMRKVGLTDNRVVTKVYERGRMYIYIYIYVYCIAYNGFHNYL